MLKKIAIIFIILILLFFLPHSSKIKTRDISSTWWQFQSIDTMKYSRDLARERHSDSSFDKIINQQVKDIADTGATHIAIATPYDEEFFPMLQKWVAAARQNNLKIWFRGNFSGWEGWFDYDKISRSKHLEMTKKFIADHKDIFQDGDVFTACPECENGGPGDPRHNGDAEGHRQFLIDEYKITKQEFDRIGKKVASNYNSMNGDVAKVVMDKKTTAALDGIVTIDHYVATPEKLIDDVKALAESSGGKIVLGEFGVPIPDLNGQMTEYEQAQWLNRLFSLLINEQSIYGVSYWTNVGSSTALWDESGEAALAVNTIKSFYKPTILSGIIKDTSGSPIASARINLGNRVYYSDSNGHFQIPSSNNSEMINVNAASYFDQSITLSTAEAKIVLVKKSENYWYKIRKIFKNTLSF